MKQFFALDEDEIIIRESLLSGMLYQLYCCASERISESGDRLNALTMAEMYTRTEKSVIDAYRAQNLEREAYTPALWEQFDRKFPSADNRDSQDDFDDIISDSDVPF